MDLSLRYRRKVKRVTLFCGHYGSGKSNIAVNFALRLARGGNRTALADIDIVNPYFRSADSRAELETAGVEVLSLPFANTNVDLPALPSGIYGLVERRDIYAVMDIGGDDRGAYALGRFSPYILEEKNYDMVFVVNFYRPLTPDAKSALEVMREIEGACGIAFTSIVNNSNLGEETTAADVEATFEKASELSRASGLPVAFVSFDERLDPAPKCENPFAMKLQKKPF